MPWIYGKPERPEVNENSAYNRKPKGTKFSLNYETRLAMIRRNLAQQEGRQLQLRKDRLAKKKPTDDEAWHIAVIKALKGEESAARFQAGTKKAKQTGPKEVVDEVTKRKGSPVKKTAGASKGGQLSKKERETMALSRDRMEGREETDETK